MNYEQYFITDVSKLDINSLANVEILCSDECARVIVNKYVNCIKNIKNNDGKYICIRCYNSNNKVNPINENIINNLDSEENLYLLGWLLTNYNPDCISVKAKQCDYELMKKLKDLISKNISIYDIDEFSISFNIESKQIINDVSKYLHIMFDERFIDTNPNTYTHILENKNLYWSLIRGIFESGNSIINYTSSEPSCIIDSECETLLNNIGYYSDIPYQRVESSLIYNGNNCIDFLNNIYKNHKYNDLYLYRKYSSFVKCLTRNFSPNLHICKVLKTDKDAVIPNKKNISDVGFDITIIKLHKKLNENTYLYDTGIVIIPKYGYYTELAPRSSLSKSGYMLSNSIGIIENTYRGNLYVALTKVEKNAPDLKLPFRCAQLIFKPQVHMDIEEISYIPKEKTVRGSGGFGSTN